ncbi:hypothetical protein [Sphingosinicella sp.]
MQALAEPGEREVPLYRRRKLCFNGAGLGTEGDGMATAELPGEDAR